MKNLRVLFISRAFPPTIGGIEKQNYELYRNLQKISNVTLIANKNGKIFLLFFLPYALVKSIWLANQFDIILLGDGVLAIIAPFLRCLTRKPVACILHGLDITYRNRIYQALWVKRFLPKVDRFFPVSQETARIAIAKGLNKQRCIVIPNGVNPEEFKVTRNRNDLDILVGHPLHDRLVLVTLGRLVERKGVAWFIENVIPNLDPNIVYVIAGDGPMRTRITSLINQLELNNRVFLLGPVTTRERNILYGSSDIFIQPNIRVKGDIEGFGLVVLEAGVAGLPVIASRLEGLKDAIIPGKNGISITPETANEFVDNISWLSDNPEERAKLGKISKKFILENYQWSAIATKYLNSCIDLHRNHI